MMSKIAFILPMQVVNTSSGNAKRMMQIINIFNKNKNNQIDIFCDDYSLTTEFKDENLICKNYHRNISKIKRVNLYNNQIDDWICPNFYKEIKGIVKNDKYDLVWCNYPFMSKYLKCFNADNKVIDTHDNFLHRNELLGQISWFSSNSKELYKAFSRANFAVSIAQKEFSINLNIFHNIKHIFLPYINGETKRAIKKVGNGKIKIGFIGSVNSVNISAIKNIEIIAKELQNINFYIAGKISEHINSDLNNIIKIGTVKNLNKFYSEIDASISPTFNSTGQKIKVLESIMNGIPCFTSTDSKPDFIEGYFANNIHDLNSFIKILSNIDRNNLFDVISIQQKILTKINDQIKSAISEISNFKNNTKFVVKKEK